MGSERLGTPPATGSASRPPGAHSRLPLESRLPLLVLLGGLPGVVVSLVWLWTGNHGIEVRWTLTVVVVVVWLLVLQD